MDKAGKLNLIEELNWRGLIYQKTPGIEKVFDRGATIYFGIDPTADSLHVGHLLGLLTLKRAYNLGQKIIILTACGTAMIGDPSGKDSERPILAKAVLHTNKEKLRAQINKFFQVDNQKVKMADNADWLEKEQLIDFLRNVGKYISTNAMLDMESVKTRISRQEGISYAEFSYQILQAYDFLRFYEDYDCEVQLGGSDQWGNMIRGVELIRRKINKEAHILSFPLLVNPRTGKKFGKTEQGAAIWLDPDKTHPFSFYQFLVNVDDELAPILLKYFSFKPQAEIQQLINDWEKEKEKRLLQKTLAYELTTLVHGSKIADQSKAMAEILFNQSQRDLTRDDLEFIKKALPYMTVNSQTELNLEEVLVNIKLAASKGEARRLIEQKGIDKKLLFDKYFLIRKGKREYGVVEIRN